MPLAQSPTSVTVELCSDTAFGAGFDPGGPADVEVNHDPATGLPVLPGSTLRALLRDAWLGMAPAFPGDAVEQAACRCFGPVGDVAERAILHVGDGMLPAALGSLVGGRIANKDLRPAQVLEALTEVRAQTAIDADTGGPARGSLRLVRVVQRGLVLSATLTWMEAPTSTDTAVLAAATLAVRHLGLSRSRGRGVVDLRLDDDRPATLEAFRRLMAGNQR